MMSLHLPISCALGGIYRGRVPLVEMEVIVFYCTALATSTGSDITWVVGNWPQNEYLHHGNRKLLQSKAFYFFPSENKLLDT